MPHLPFPPLFIFATCERRRAEKDKGKKGESCCVGGGNLAVILHIVDKVARKSVFPDR